MTWRRILLQKIGGDVSQQTGTEIGKIAKEESAKPITAVLPLPGINYRAHQAGQPHLPPISRN